MWTQSTPDDELVVMRALTEVYGHPVSADALARGESAIRAAAQHDNVIPLAGRRRRLAARVGAGAAAATIALSSAGVAAAAGAAPGQLLYPMKTATEQVWAAIAPGDMATARLHLRFAERRLAELQALQELSRSQVQALHRAFLEHLAAAELLGGDTLAADVHRVRAAGQDLFRDRLSRQDEPDDRPASQPPDLSATATPRPTPTPIPTAPSASGGAIPTIDGTEAGTAGDVPLQQPAAPAAPADHAQDSPRQPTAHQPADDADDVDDPSAEEPQETDEPDDVDEAEIDEPDEADDSRDADEPDDADEADEADQADQAEVDDPVEEPDDVELPDVEPPAEADEPDGDENPHVAEQDPDVPDVDDEPDDDTD